MCIVLATQSPCLLLARETGERFISPIDQLGLTGYFKLTSAAVGCQGLQLAANRYFLFQRFFKHILVKTGSLKCTRKMPKRSLSECSRKCTGNALECFFPLTKTCQYIYLLIRVSLSQRKTFLGCIQPNHDPCTL